MIGMLIDSYAPSIIKRGWKRGKKIRNALWRCECIKKIDQENHNIFLTKGATCLTFQYSRKLQHYCGISVNPNAVKLGPIHLPLQGYK